MLSCAVYSAGWGSPVQACAMPNWPTGCGGSWPGRARPKSGRAGEDVCAAIGDAHHVIVDPPCVGRDGVAVYGAERAAGGVVADIDELLFLKSTSKMTCSLPWP